jgi:hypothetical protein
MSILHTLNKQMVLLTSRKPFFFWYVIFTHTNKKLLDDQTDIKRIQRVTLSMINS